MYQAMFNGKVYDETAVKLMELEQAKEALALFKSGRDLKNIFTQEERDSSDKLYKQWNEESGGKLRSTDVHIKATGMTAEEFLEQFYICVKDQQKMLAANPQHFLITDDLNNMHVLEVAAGHASEFFTVFNDDFLKEVDPTPGYPLRMVANCYTKAGVRTGGVLHEFKTTDEGFEGILGIYFPAAIDEISMRHHWEHLSVEFYNWYCFGMQNLGRA